MTGYILVVEDSADLNELFCRRLQKAGYQVRPAYTVKEALLTLAADDAPPRLIVLDLELPDGNGTDILPLMQTPKYAETKVMVVSAKAYTREDGLADFHVDQILVKPLSPKHLVMLVNSHLQ